MLADHLNQQFRGLEDLIIGQADYRPAERLKHFLALNVSLNHLIESMHAAVDLDDQTKPVTGEVGVVRTNGVLAAELVAFELSAAKGGPDAFLCVTQDWRNARARAVRGEVMLELCG